MKTKVLLSFMLLIFMGAISFSQEKKANKKPQIEQVGYEKITGTYKALKDNAEIYIDSNSMGLLYKVQGKPALVLKPAGKNLYKYETRENKLEFEFMYKENLLIIIEKGNKKTYKKVK